MPRTKKAQAEEEQPKKETKKKESAAKTHEALCKKLAIECIEGKYGVGIQRKHIINSLGYGNIYNSVQKYVTMILAGQL